MDDHCYVDDVRYDLYMLFCNFQSVILKHKVIPILKKMGHLSYLSCLWNWRWSEEAFRGVFRGGTTPTCIGISFGQDRILGQPRGPEHWVRRIFLNKNIAAF